MQRAKVSTEVFTEETKALKALTDYEWTKIKASEIFCLFVLMHTGTNG